MLFTRNGDLIFAIFAGLIVANMMILIADFLGIRLFVRLLKIPKRILMPIIITLCVVGIYGLNNRVFDAGILIFFGLIGYLMEKYEFPLPSVVLGFILEPMIEINMRGGIMAIQGSFMPFITKPISFIFLLATVISIFITVLVQLKKANETEKVSV